MRIVFVFFSLVFATAVFAQTPDTTAKCPCDYPTLVFKTGPSLNNDMKSMLSSVAAKLKGFPFCNIIFVGYPGTSKHEMALCQVRLANIKRYFTETAGISSDRIVTNSELGRGDKNSIDIKCDQ